MGPPDSHELLAFKKETKRLKQVKNKQELTDQFLTAKKHEYEMSIVERQQDKITIEQDLRAAKEYEQRKKTIEQQQKEQNARVWIEQANQKYKAN